MSELDSTLAQFPTYGELTQTQAWKEGSPPRVKADSNEVAEAILVPQESRYVEGPLLGKGGMGKVVLARDARIGRDVAIKLLHAERELEPEDRARFLREAQVQGQLEHPSIVPVYDIERRRDGTTFFTMRRVHGHTLSAIIADLKRGDATALSRHTLRELLTAFGTVCLAVDYAHSRGVVHRDLKPSNIMLGDFGEVYVLDWGLARLVDERGRTADDPEARLSLPGSFLGTPLYMAPEQMVNPDVGPTADVYSLGLILFEILTLERARDPQTLYTPVDARPTVRAPARNVAPELEAICVKATAAEPDQRFASARALQEAIARYLEGDRDLARRHELAAQYAREATAALARADEPGADPEGERTEAVRKLRSALALDPDDTENVRVLAAIITTPPKKLPREVRDELMAQEQALVRTGARYSVGASLGWFLFLPLVMWMGLHEGLPALLILGPAGVAATASAIAARLPRIPYSLQVVVVIASVAGGAATSAMYGPSVLAPTLLATFTIVIQAHPSRAIRWLAVVCGTTALIAIAVIELIWPTSYQQIGRALAIVPTMHELPREGSILFLLGASLAMLIVPCMFIGRVREALTAAQRQILVQAWQFRRFGEDLITTKKT